MSPPLAFWAPPADTSTLSLLHFNGSNGSTTITDSKGITWSNSGSIPLSTTTQKFGTASLLVPTTANAFLYSNDPVFNKASLAVFTCECFFNPHSGNYNTIFQTRNTTTNGTIQPFSITATPTGQIEIYIGNASLSGWSAGANYGSGATANTWHHIAIVGDGTNISVYLNGTSIYSGTHPNWSSGADIQCFGTPYWGTAGPTYIDEFRYSNVACYTSTFTPPTAEFM